MKEYTIRKTPGGIVVWCDRVKIDLNGLFEAIATPTFDYGKICDSAMNLGYAILRDCAGEAAAGQIYDDFTRKFLLAELPEISIPVEAIHAFVKENASKLLDAQSGPKWKKITP